MNRIFIPKPRRTTDIRNLLQVRPEKYQEIQNLQEQIKAIADDINSYEKDELINTIGNIRTEILKRQVNI